MRISDPRNLVPVLCIALGHSIYGGDSLAHEFSPPIVLSVVFMKEGSFTGGGGTSRRRRKPQEVHAITMDGYPDTLEEKGIGPQILGTMLFVAKLCSRQIRRFTST